MRVLLVSGSAQIHQQVAAALAGHAGGDIVEVATPARALHHLDSGGRFDAVVADNDTHPAGGLFLAREVRARAAAGRDVPPVVLLLARSQDVWLSNWAQADAYALKPVDPFDLAEVIEALAAGEPVPALPGVGGAPAPSSLDPPAGGEPPP